MKPLYKQVHPEDTFLGTIDKCDVYLRPDRGFYYMTHIEGHTDMVLYSSGRRVMDCFIPESVHEFCKAHRNITT